MSDNNNTLNIPRIRRMLKETSRMAENATLTGALADAARSSTQQYNATLRSLEEYGELPKGFFVPLPDNASLAEVGFACGQLAAYLDDEPQSTSGNASAGTEANPQNPFNFWADMGLKNVGEAIRRHMWEGMRGDRPGWPQAWNGDWNVDIDVDSAHPTLDDLDRRIAEVNVQLQEVSEKLRATDLTDAQQIELSEQLAGLSQLQAKLARKRARVKEREQAS